jgi:hypothetical protein
MPIIDDRVSCACASCSFSPSRHPRGCGCPGVRRRGRTAEILLRHQLAVLQRQTAARPRPPSSSPGPAPWPSSAPAFPAHPRGTTRAAGRTQGCTPDSAAHVKPEHADAARPWPSVEKPTVRTDRPHGPDAVRYTSVDTATHRPAVKHPDTWRDTKKTAPGAGFRSQGAVFAGGGRCWVRTNVG